MNVLVVTGSPREGGNSEILADAFCEGACAAGHAIRRIDAGRARIEACRACYSCIENGGTCCVDDDMQRFYCDLEWCDTLVFAFPLYWFSCTAQIKAFIDRMFCGVGGRPFGVKKVALICPFEDSDIHKADGLVKSFQIYADYCGYELVGTLLAPCVNKMGDALKSPALAEAYQLGERLA